MEKLETWIRDTIGSGFRWCIRSMDTYQNRKMITNIILDDIEKSKGIVLGENTFIEKI